MIKLSKNSLNTVKDRIFRLIDDFKYKPEWLRYMVPAAAMFFAGGICIAANYSLITEPSETQLVSDVSDNVPKETLPYIADDQSDEEEESVDYLSYLLNVPDLTDEYIGDDDEIDTRATAVRLNMAYRFSSLDEDSDPEPMNSYAGQAFMDLSEKDSDWMGTIYGISRRTPKSVAASIGKNLSGADSIEMWKQISISFRDGDGKAISGYSNARDIISLASVYAYYNDIRDKQTFFNYVNTLWQASHRYSISVSNIYYCDGSCVTQGVAEEITGGEGDEGEPVNVPETSSSKSGQSVEASAAEETTVPASDPSENSDNEEASTAESIAESGTATEAETITQSGTATEAETTTRAETTTQAETITQSGTATQAETTAQAEIITQSETATQSDTDEQAQTLDITPIESLNDNKFYAQAFGMSSRVIRPDESLSDFEYFESDDQTVSSDSEDHHSEDHQDGEESTETSAARTTRIFTYDELHAMSSEEIDALLETANPVEADQIYYYMTVLDRVNTGLDTYPDETEEESDHSSSASSDDSDPTYSDESVTESSDDEELETTVDGKVVSTKKGVCPGHVDLTVTATIIGLDEVNNLFTKDQLGNNVKEDSSWSGWTALNRLFAKAIAAQDWYATYGLSVSTSLYVRSPLTASEIAYYMDMMPADTSQKRRDVIYTALQSVGTIPYYWGGKPSSSGYDSNKFGTIVMPDYKGRNLRGLDCSGWINWVYWTALGSSLRYESTSGLAVLGTKVNRSDLKPGDIIITTGSTSHVVMFLAWADSGKQSMYVIHETGLPTNNVTVSRYQVYWPYYRDLIND